MRTLWISGRQTNRAIRRPQDRRRKPLLEDLEGRQLLSIFPVTSNSNNTNTTETGSLWEAIYDSNNTPGPTPNTITFDITVNGKQGIQPIKLTSALPIITQPVIIDGFTQPDTGTGPTPGIELNGNKAVAVGLELASSGSTIEGLAIVNFTSDGVQINSASGNWITDNYIGVTTSGGAGGNEGNGVKIQGNSSANTIGGTASGTGNTISDNPGIGTDITGNGVYITGGSSGNLVEGNRIGTDETGDDPLPNAENGVLIDASSPDNTIGGTVSGAANTISANAVNGIEITGDSSGNLVAKNKIGTDAGGDGDDSGDLANQNNGVYITGGSTFNTIGATTSGAYNVISDNQANGIAIDDSSSNNLLEGNRIGTEANGTVAMKNGLDGVLIESGASSNTIGGTGVGAFNLISGNQDSGVSIDDANQNMVLGNLIGTELNGTSPLKGSVALPNHDYGVLVHGDAADNTIGGTTAGDGNTISGNDHSGVEIASGASDNLFEGNWIGTNTNGTAHLANVLSGVVITGSTTTGNTIGGSITGAGNVISGNKEYGVYVEDLASNTLLEGNWIGTNFGGTASLANDFDGMLVDDAIGTTIGGAGAGNVISGNSAYGVHINSNSTGSLLEGNFIGTNAAGSHDVYNGWDGVEIDGSSDNTIGGTASGDGNTISHNKWDGISISSNSHEEGNLIEGNVIDSNGSGGTQNSERDGVYIYGAGAANNTIGGTATGAGNTISHNTYDGVYLNNTGVATINNSPVGNLIEDDVIDHNGNDGIELTNAPSTTVMGCTIEYDTGWGIVGSGTSINSTIPHKSNTLEHDGHNDNIQL